MKVLRQWNIELHSWLCACQPNYISTRRRVVQCWRPHLSPSVPSGGSMLSASIEADQREIVGGNEEHSTFWECPDGLCVRNLFPHQCQWVESDPLAYQGRSTRTQIPIG